MMHHTLLYNGIQELSLDHKFEHPMLDEYICFELLVGLYKPHHTHNTMNHGQILKNDVKVIGLKEIVSSSGVEEFVPLKEHIVLHQRELVLPHVQGVNKNMKLFVVYFRFVPIQSFYCNNLPLIYNYSSMFINSRTSFGSLARDLELFCHRFVDNVKDSRSLEFWAISLLSIVYDSLTLVRSLQFTTTLMHYFSNVPNMTCRWL